MASEGNWSTVPMKNKPNRIENPKSKKNQTKTFIENMPRIEVNAPLKTSKTAYDAFIEQQKNIKPSATTMNNNLSPESRKNREKKEKPKTIEEASKKLEEADIQSMINRAQTSVKSSNTEAWIKELTVVFNSHFKYLSQPDLINKDKNKNYPASALKRECCDKLLSALKKASSQTLEQIYFLSTQNMVNESHKGSVYGYQVILQLLSRDNPSIIIPRLNQYLEILYANKLKERQCDLVLWSLSQCSSRDMKVGLKAIMVDYIPAMRIKVAASSSLQYIEDFFKKHNNLSEGFGEISIKDYFTVIDIMFNSKTFIEPEHRDRLNKQLEKVKTVAYGKDPKNSLRNFFPHYLSRLDNNSPAAQQNEYLSSLVTCLSTDKQCFPDWCQLYTKHLPQSSFLLEYIVQHYNVVIRKLPRNVLRQTVRSFSLTNEELSQGKNKNKKEGLEKCIENCKVLQLKLSQSGFPWKLMLFMFLLIGGGVVAYDINTSRSVQASKTMKLLEKYGVVNVANTGWKNVQNLNKQTQAWLNVNAPMYRDQVVPYLSLAWNKTAEACVQVRDVTRPYIIKAGEKIQEGINRFNTEYPDFWPKCVEYFNQSWQFIKHHTQCTVNCLVHYSQQAYNWLLQNVLVGQLSPENLQKTAVLGLQVVQNYTTAAITWCRNTIASASAS